MSDLLTEAERRIIEGIRQFSHPGHSGLTPGEEDMLTIIDRIAPRDWFASKEHLEEGVTVAAGRLARHR